MQSYANGELPAARGRFVGGSFFLNIQEHNVDLVHFVCLEQQYLRSGLHQKLDNNQPIVTQKSPYLAVC